MISYNASELHRVMVCAGYHALAAPIPKPDQTDDAKEGDAAHWAVLQMIRHDDGDEWKPPKKAANGWPIDTTMLYHARGFVDAIAGYGSDVQHAEYKCDWMLTENIKIKCRVDWAAWDGKTETLYIEDYKYGWRAVEVRGNWQLIAGAIGVARSLGVQPKRFVLTIHQPRPFHKDGRRRSWETTGGVIGEYWSEMTHKLAVLSDELVTGDHCRGCRAGPAHCVAHRTAGYNAVDVILNSQATEFDGASHALELDILSRAEKIVSERKSWLEDLAKERLRQGEIIPGHALDTAYGKATWKSQAAARRIQKETGLKLFETKPVTPAEAIRRGVDEDLIKDNTDRPKRGQKLVKATTTEIAERIFGNND